MSQILIVNHNSGFFSCCSVRLLEIIRYFNKNKKIPQKVVSERCYKWYKVNTELDVTFNYFEHYDTIAKQDFTDRDIQQGDLQFTNYSDLDYNQLAPFIKKYFSPSVEVQSMMDAMTAKYQMDFANLAVLFYRGNDKIRETTLCGYNEYIEKARGLLAANPDLRFWIQSDETEFIELMLATFPANSFVMGDEIRHMKKQNSTVDANKERIDWFSKNYLAITIMMSRCKYVVCGSGNCSLWIMLYRGHARNILQNLNGSWISTIEA